MPALPIITTLAEYQTRFWLKVGLELKRRGQPASFVSFDSRSNELLRGAGLDCIDATASAAEIALGDRDPVDVCRAFGIDDLNYWLAHEKYAFDVRDSGALVRKLAGSLLVLDEAIGRLRAAHDPIMVQEVGGFLSVVAAHFAARRHGLPSWFIEPSFFRGRMLFLEGSFAARTFAADLEAPVEGPVAQYLSDTLKQDAIVIPAKDRHQYTTAFRKVVNWYNLRRLGEKLIDKHLLGKEQEFGHIGSHVSRHLRMLTNSRMLRRHYTPIDACGRFVYYPLHVPGDMALTLRSPEYLNQLALIDYLCRSVPFGTKVAIKEHPAMIGAIEADRLVELLQRHDNLALLPPSTNNFVVLRRAEAVVSVNSKSGAEAGLLGKRVLVLGDAFYRRAPFATKIDALPHLHRTLANTLSGETAPPDRDRVLRWFAGLWPQTSPGELYVTDEANITTFASSLMDAIQ